MNEKETEYCDMFIALWLMTHGYDEVKYNLVWAMKETVNLALGNRVAMDRLKSFGVVTQNVRNQTYQLNKEYQNGTNQSK
jgi:phosphopantetheinyl transferase (holo-ACP synthase)